MRDACPTNLALFKRNCYPSPICLRCGKQNESATHLFLKCQLLVRIWRASRLGFDFEVGTPVSLAVCLQGWIKDAPDDSDIILSIHIMWNIWLARNKFVWEGREFNLEKLLNAIDAMYQVKLTTINVL